MLSVSKIQVNFSTESNLQKLIFFLLVMKHYSYENIKLTLVLFVLVYAAFKIKK